MGGGTDLLPQLQRGIRPADEVVDLRAAVPRGHRGRRRGPADRRRDPRSPTSPAIADVAARYAVLAQAAAAVASPQLREMGTVAGQPVPGRALLVLPPSRPAPAGCAAATPATPRSATTASTASSRATASRSRRPTWRPPCWRWTRPSRRTGARRFPLADLYRQASADDRSTLALEQGELITAVTVPQAPAASAYVRAGRAGGVELRPVRGRGGPRSATARGWRRSASRTCPACSTRPIRWRACPASR